MELVVSCLASIVAIEFFRQRYILSRLKKRGMSLVEPLDFEGLCGMSDDELKNVQIEERNTYAYNPFSHAIYVYKKEKYYLFDIFAFLYEVGHVIDDKDGKLKRHMMIIGFYRTIIIPAYLLTSLYVFLQPSSVGRNITLAMAVIGTALCIFRCYTIIRDENVASAYAVSKIAERFGSQPCAEHVKKFARSCMLQQLAMSVEFGLAFWVIYSFQYLF